MLIKGRGKRVVSRGGGKQPFGRGEGKDFNRGEEQTGCY